MFDFVVRSTSSVSVAYQCAVFGRLEPVVIVRHRTLLRLLSSALPHASTGLGGVLALISVLKSHDVSRSRWNVCVYPVAWLWPPDTCDAQGIDP